MIANANSWKKSLIALAQLKDDALVTPIEVNLLKNALIEGHYRLEKIFVEIFENGTSGELLTEIHRIVDTLMLSLFNSVFCTGLIHELSNDDASVDSHNQISLFTDVEEEFEFEQFVSMFHIASHGLSRTRTLIDAFSSSGRVVVTAALCATFETVVGLVPNRAMWHACLSARSRFDEELGKRHCTTAPQIQFILSSLYDADGMSLSEELRDYWRDADVAFCNAINLDDRILNRILLVSKFLSVHSRVIIIGRAIQVPWLQLTDSHTVSLSGKSYHAVIYQRIDQSGGEARQSISVDDDEVDSVLGTAGSVHFGGGDEDDSSVSSSLFGSGLLASSPSDGNTLNKRKKKKKKSDESQFWSNARLKLPSLQSQLQPLSEAQITSSSLFHHRLKESISSVDIYSPESLANSSSADAESDGLPSTNTPIKAECLPMDDIMSHLKRSSGVAFRSSSVSAINNTSTTSPMSSKQAQPMMMMLNSNIRRSVMTSGLRHLMLNERNLNHHHRRNRSHSDVSQSSNSNSSLSVETSRTNQQSKLSSLNGGNIFNENDDDDDDGVSADQHVDHASNIAEGRTPVLSPPYVSPMLRNNDEKDVYDEHDNNNNEDGGEDEDDDSSGPLRASQEVGSIRLSRNGSRNLTHDQLDDDLMEIASSRSLAVELASRSSHHSSSTAGDNKSITRTETSVGTVMTVIGAAIRGTGLGERRHGARNGRAMSTTSSLQVDFSDSEDETQTNDDLVSDGGVSVNRSSVSHHPQRLTEENVEMMRDSDVDSTSSPNTSHSTMTHETNHESALHRVRQWMTGNRQR